jgi:hypothetical protein
MTSVSDEILPYRLKNKKQWEDVSDLEIEKKGVVFVMIKIRKKKACSTIGVDWSRLEKKI